MILMADIEQAFSERGLKVVGHGGDLELSAIGGFGSEVAFRADPVAVSTRSTSMNNVATMWHGAAHHTGAMVIKGTLVLEMMDLNTKKILWEGAVSDHLDF